MVLQAYSQLEGAEIAYRRAHQLAPSHFVWNLFIWADPSLRGTAMAAVKSLARGIDPKSWLSPGPPESS